MKFAVVLIVTFVIRNTEHTHPVYLALMLFCVSTLCIDVVQFCRKSASCHFTDKAKLRQPYGAPLTENRTVGVILTPRASKTLVTPLSTGTYSQ